MSALSHNTPGITDMGAPFADTDADIIIRSSDLYDFRLHRFILSKASDAFRDLLSIPQPIDLARSIELSDGYRDGLPIITLSENHRVLDVLFRIIYPVDIPSVSSLHLDVQNYPNSPWRKCYSDGTRISELSDLLDASDKYALIARVPSTFSSLLLSVPKIGYRMYDLVHPETVLRCACQYDLTQAANEMVKLTLQRMRAQVTNHKDLQALTVPQYRAILDYREQVTTAAIETVRPAGKDREILIDGDRFPAWDSDCSPSCTCRRQYIKTLEYDPTGGEIFRSHVLSPYWVQKYLDNCADALSIVPHTKSVRHSVAMDHAFRDGMKCPHCRHHLYRLDEFADCIAALVESNISKVSFVISVCV